MFSKNLLLAGALCSSAQAWWNNGHMITARVAYDHLKEHNPEVLRKAEEVLKPIVSMNQHELDHSFVESATFADDIKEKGWNDLSPWHYIDKPYVEGSFNGTLPFPENYNVTWSIQYMHDNLKLPHTNESQGVTWALGDAFNLRFLIHYCGDVHQPLHTTSMFSQEFPNGDMGGNLYMLETKDNITELHALWDSCVYEFDQDFPRPLSDDSWDKLTKISQDLRQENPFDSSVMQALIQKPSSEWADEGHKIAVDFVYNIKEHSLPTEDYVK